MIRMITIRGIFVVKEPIRFRNEIRELIMQNAGIVREKTRLQNAIDKNFRIKK